MYIEVAWCELGRQHQDGSLMQVLDSALTRPGRLSRRVVVPLPDEAGRASIMAVHLRNTPMGSIEAKRDACGIVARISNGMSGAELASVCNEGALLAGRRSAEVSFPATLLSDMQCCGFLLA